jgi:hypothetical protein
MEEAYRDKNEKGVQLRAMINQLKDLLEDSGDAIMMVPLIKEYMDLLIKNDDVIIKMLGIIQKIETAAARAQEENGGIMSDRDRQLLFESLDDLGVQ